MWCVCVYVCMCECVRVYLRVREWERVRDYVCVCVWVCVCELSVSYLGYYFCMINSFLFPCSLIAHKIYEICEKSQNILGLYIRCTCGAWIKLWCQKIPVTVTPIKCYNREAIVLAANSSLCFYWLKTGAIKW